MQNLKYLNLFDKFAKKNEEEYIRNHKRNNVKYQNQSQQPAQSRWETAKATKGVGTNPSRRYTLIPWLNKTAALILANPNEDKVPNFL